MVTTMNWAASFLHSLFAFIIILVPLVVFHEFGHFVFARIFGVKAEIFSVGFGPRLWSRQIGETEFRLSAIPMGGYVKLLGEDRDTQLSPEDAKRSLHLQEPWKRFFIFFGGPLFNFIFAVFLFMMILMIGEPQLSNVIGRVVHGSVAEKAGFQSGDRVLAIHGKPVVKFDEIVLTLNENPGKSLDFQVLHPKQTTPVTIEAMTSSPAGFSIYGESKRVGEIDGLLPFSRTGEVGISNSQSIAGKAGMATGDKITEWDRTAISTWEELDSRYAQLKAGDSFALGFQKAKTNEKKTVTLQKPKTGALHDLGNDFGLYSSELFVEKTVSKSPAETAGVLSGDRLVGIGSKPVQSFYELKDAVQRSGEKDGTVLLQWERLGKLYSAKVTATATSGRDPILNKTVQYTVGVMPMLTLAEPDTYVERIWNPFRLVVTATERMITFSWRNLVSLRKMFVGEVSVGTLGGPLMIGKIAGESLARGLISFLTNMAIFSIGLGVLNVLPIPVLDGGHLLLLGVEMIRGRPLSLRQMELLQGVGLVLILTLMGIAFHNDIARLFYS